MSERSSRPPGLFLIGLLAVSAGATVANLYYSQPILGTIASQFNVSTSAASLIVTCTQLGYALSLLLVVPLGDIFERRKLIVVTTAGSALLLVAVALSPGFHWMLLTSFLLGAASVAPQLVVPYSAGLVGIERRGRVVGTVMSGLLVGILLSRSLSGLLAAAAGWRTVYWTSAGLALGLSIVLRWCLPAQRPENELAPHYGQLLASLWDVARTQPILRRHSVIGACGFGAFSVFWTTLVFHLASLPGHYGSSVAGLFGLLGVAGALAAPIAGRLADRHDARLVNGTALALVVVAFLLMGVAGRSLFALAVGVVLMDAGVQGSHISNQTRIFGLNATLRNRVNSVYMVVYFIGGACGSALGSWAWAHGGWGGVCWCGGAFGAAGLLPLFIPAADLRGKSLASCR
jgi:predicted MFS family arabinose efflux permease